MVTKCSRKCAIAREAIFLLARTRMSIKNKWIKFFLFRSFNWSNIWRIQSARLRTRGAFMYKESSRVETAKMLPWKLFNLTRSGFFIFARFMINFVRLSSIWHLKFMKVFLLSNLCEHCCIMNCWECHQVLMAGQGHVRPTSL